MRYGRRHSLAAQQRNHTRLKSDGVGTLCLERCADGGLSGTQSSEVSSLARQVLQQLDPNAFQTVLAAVPTGSASGSRGGSSALLEAASANQQMISGKLSVEVGNG